MSIGQITIVFVLALAAGTFARELGDPIGPKALEDLLDNDEVQFLFDFRTNASRDVDGYIETSILVPEDLNLEGVKAGGGAGIIPKGNE
jgi:hypothetical protein